MAPEPTRVTLARQILTELGVTLANLQNGAPDDTSQCPGTARVPTMPTMAEYLPRVAAAAGPGAARTYRSYWTRMNAAWEPRPLDSITASDIEALQRRAVATARKRRTSRGGQHAGEHVIAAARSLFNPAVADGLLQAAANPAHRVAKPRRLPQHPPSIDPRRT